VPKPGAVSTNRLESFSDGVIAVAITLLVLDIHVPSPGAPSADGKVHRLGYNLLHLWPNYAAYAISFITIGIIWINHHAMISRLREADHVILILNLLLLLTIGVLPFATSLMAAYVRQPAGGAHLAAVVYGGALLLMSIAFATLNRHILLDKPHLIDPPLPASRRRQILFRSVVGISPYVFAIALAPVSAYITLAISGAVAAFYALPLASGQERARPPRAA
jgi:uncharacterized membrane protein